MKKQRIENVPAVFLVIGAIVVDLFNWIPGVGSVVTAIAWFIFNLYFYFKGISIFSGKKLAANLGAIIVGLIPFLDVLPETLVGMIAIIMYVRAEDKLGIKIPTTPTKAVPPILKS